MGELLEIADTGIQGLETKVEPFDASRFLPSMPEEIRADILQRIQQFRGKATLQIEGISLVSEENEQAQLFTLLTEHKTVDGMRTSFSLDAESDGTKRLMHLAPALLDLQSEGKVYVIDELDRSLHPHLSRLFVDTFLQNAKSGGCCGQMIVTTHDTSLLDLSLLRRDEIWFVEKDDQDASRLTSLAEFKGEVRADLKVAKSYLNGRFGAVPIIRDTRRLFRKKGAQP
jgi:hypothetical protein